MKLRYKLIITLGTIGILALVNVWLGVTGIIFFFAWCVVQAGKIDDDCMIDEEQYTDQKKSKVMVAPDGEIEWGAVRP